MKHVEQIKSFVLFLLVVLSLILTFSIWSYTPNYQIIEESQVEQISIGEQKELYDVIKPYRLLVHENGSFSGTSASTVINDVMETISELNATELRFIQSNLTEERINSMIHSDKQLTLFFSAEVPVNTFRSVLEFSQKELPEISFSHLIIDYSNFSQSKTIQLLFVSEQNRTLYSSDVAISEDHFDSTFVEAIQKTVPFEEIIRSNALSLYVPVDPVELVQYTYYIDEVSPEIFKEVLFKDPNIVRKNIESATSTKYTDGMAFMTSDTDTKTINYVYPASESVNDIKQSVLLQDSFDFINEHGGMTGDYRYVYSNVAKHTMEYQLFLKGLPVYSSIAPTRITTTWGDTQIFRYKRPYYLLDMDITSEKTMKQLPSGVQMVSTLQNLDDIDEIILGYYLKQTDNNLLYTLEPSWFVILDGSWTRLTSDSIGGNEYGLE